jgi:septal ring factor EnvC (AmiA/AmiB activator)
MSTEIYYQLHDRYTRGETLSEEEQLLLFTWYAKQDESEAQQITTKSVTVSTNSQLQEQIQEAATQLQHISQQIGETTVANESIRREIAVLKDQLAQHISGKAA